MNLFYLARKGHKRLRVTGAAAPATLAREGASWQGMQLSGGDELCVLRASDCAPFRACPEEIGWSAARLDGAVALQVDVVAAGSDRPLASTGPIALDDALRTVRLRWPIEPAGGAIDLRISAVGEGRLFLAVSHPLDRGEVLRKCIGRGVELGPGPRPQILPGAETDVFYVEQSAPADWRRLYGDAYPADFDPALADRYVIGEAHRVPAEPASLDFIFASHVFEHLVNPLGHLELWSRLLRPGGTLALVVPDYIGSKDFLAAPSEMAEFAAEYDAGAFAPTMRHYDRFAMSRENPAAARKMFDAGASIHVHFYSNENMSALVAEACARFGYAGFALRHAANAKDFHVVATR